MSKGESRGRGWCLSLQPLVRFDTDFRRIWWYFTVQESNYHRDKLSDDYNKLLNPSDRNFIPFSFLMSMSQTRFRNIFYFNYISLIFFSPISIQRWLIDQSYFVSKILILLDAQRYLIFFSPILIDFDLRRKKRSGKIPNASMFLTFFHLILTLVEQWMKESNIRVCILFRKMSFLKFRDPAIWTTAETRLNHDF